MMNAGGAAYFKGVGDPEEILGLKDEVLEKEGANMDKEMLVRVGNPLEALRNVEDHCDDEEVGYEQEDDGDVKKIPPPGIRDGQAFRVRDDNDVLEEEAGYGDDGRSGNDYDEGEERKDEKKRLEKTEMTNGCGKKGVEEEDEEPEEVVILNDDEGRDEEEAEVVRELPSSGGPPREVLEANDDEHEDEDDKDEEQEEDGDVDDVPLPKVGGARIYSVGDDEDDNDNGNDDDDDDGDELEEEEGGDGDDCDLNEDEEDDDDEEEEDEEFGTEYLVRPIARAEDEEHLSDFDPGEENDEDDDIDEDDDDGDDDDLDGIAKHGTSAKRKRAFEKDCSNNEEPSNR